LRALPGVGEYTAGAVASLAFGEAVPAVDGNVARVLSRFDDSTLDPASVAGRRALAAAAKRLMPPETPGPFNEGLIELGAVVCRPGRPLCDECPLASGCLGRERGTAATLPRTKARPTPTAVLSVRAVVTRGGRALLVRRPADASLLPDFEEFPGEWIEPDRDPREALAKHLASLGLRRPRVGVELARARHAVTRYRITAVAYAVRVDPQDRLAALDVVHRFASAAVLKGDSVTTETRKLARAIGAAALRGDDS
jgi:A/G-specific adenine glycosylase